MTIPRKNSRRRPEGHIKTMYCGICKGIRDFEENNNLSMAEKEERADNEKNKGSGARAEN